MSLLLRFTHGDYSRSVSLTPLAASGHLFFTSYGHHLDLHSFPTRRSSDLGPAKTPCRAPAAGLDTAGSNYPAPGDRKSTRLNSSHAHSSYGAFCWKKKTQSTPGKYR